MNPTNWQKFFKDEAPRYLENCFTKNTDNEVEFIIRELDLKRGSRIVDIGCGTGRHSLGLATAGMVMTGIDLSHDMLAIAREKASQQQLEISFIQGDAAKTLLDEKFDYAICICEGAFGLSEPEVEPLRYNLGILKNINGMLNPGAKFIMTCLNGFKKIREHSDDDISKNVFDPYTLTTTEHMKLDDGSYVEVCEKGFLPMELTELLKTSGFKVLNLWGGTAGSWKKGPLLLDEYEIMTIAQKI